MKVIAFSGAQGTGKSFTSQKLKEMLEEDGKIVHYGYLSDKNGLSISRRIKTIGFPINENSTFETQYAITLNYLKEDLETRKVAEPSDYIIYDRSPFDHLPYSKRALKYDEYEELFNMTLNHMKRYPLDVCFWMSPIESGVDINDGTRSTDPKFQREINTMFEDLFSSHKDRQLVDSTSLSQITSQNLQERIDYPYKIIGLL